MIVPLLQPSNNRQFRRFGLETDTMERTGTVMKKKESRKVRQTRQLLEGALVELLDEKPLHKISVRELCGRADVNRSTFYAHYRDLFQLTEELEADFLAQVPFFSCSADPAVQRRLTVEFVVYVRENSKRFQMLIHSGYLTEPLIRRSLAEPGEEDEAAHRLLVRYAVHGTLQMLSAWLESGCTRPAAEVAKWIYDVAVAVRRLETAT